MESLPLQVEEAMASSPKNLAMLLNADAHLHMGDDGADNGYTTSQGTCRCQDYGTVNEA